MTTTVTSYTQDVARRIRGITRDLVSGNSAPTVRLEAGVKALDELAAEIEVQEEPEPASAGPGIPAHRLGTIHFEDPLGNRSALTVDVRKGGALDLRLGVEALDNLGPVVHDLPTCATPTAWRDVLTTLVIAQNAKPTRCYREVKRTEQPVAG